MFRRKRVRSETIMIIKKSKKCNPNLHRIYNYYNMSILEGDGRGRGKRQCRD